MHTKDLYSKLYKSLYIGLYKIFVNFVHTGNETGSTINVKQTPLIGFRKYLRKQVQLPQISNLYPILRQLAPLKNDQKLFKRINIFFVTQIRTALYDYMTFHPITKTDYTKTDHNQNEPEQICIARIFI